MHPDFAARIIRQECFLSTGVCPNGTLRQSLTSTCSAAAASNCPLLNRNEGAGWQSADFPGVNHGTAVAALVASQGPNTDLGSSPGVNLVLINVGLRSENGVSKVDRGGVKEALRWIKDQHDSPTGVKVDVVNMSFGNVASAATTAGTSCDNVVSELVYHNDILNLTSRGITLVAAAGNEGLGNKRIAYPACHSHVISVGASKTASDITCNGELNPANCMEPISSRDTHLTVAAPSRPGFLARNTIFGSSPAVTGQSSHATSWASPIVTGCAAMAKERATELNKGLNPLMLKSAMSNAPFRFDDPTDPSKTYARLDCPDALQRTLDVHKLQVNRNSLSGLFYEPATAGQGFFFDVSKSSQPYFFGVWYTYVGKDLTGTPSDHRWYSLQSNGPLDINANEILVQIYRPVGPMFRAGVLNPDPPVSKGSGRIYFTSCHSGVFEYTITDTLLAPFGNQPITINGSLEFARLEPNSSCREDDVDVPPSTSPPVDRQAQKGLSGSWFRMQESGQGFVISVGEDDAFNALDGSTGVALFAGWFTHHGQGGATVPSTHRWFTIQYARYNKTSKEWTGKIYLTTGGQFGFPATTTTEVGTATIKFHSCASGSLSYAFSAGVTNPGIDGTSGIIDIQRVGLPPDNCVGF